MSTDIREMIAKLQLQLASQGQPSFAGIQAPADPDVNSGIIQQLQQQADVNDASRQTPGDFGFLADAGKRDFQRAANQFGNAAQQGANILSFGGVSAPPDPAAVQAAQQQARQEQTAQRYEGQYGVGLGDVARGAQQLGNALGAPPPSQASQGATVQRNAILAARKVYADRIDAGDDPFAAQMAGLKVLSRAGMDVSEQQMKLADVQAKQIATKAETSKNTAQAANYSAQDTRETAKDAREEKQNTWNTIHETDGAVIQKNGLGEVRVQQKVPAALQSAQAINDVDPTVPLSPAQELIAQRIARGDMQMPNASRSPSMQSINARALALNPDLTGATFPTRQKAFAAITSGPQGNQVRSFNVSYNHLDTVNNAIDALQNGDTKGFNAIANRIALETGQPQPTNLDTALSMVKGELAKAITGAHPAEGQINQMMAGVTSANSPAQLKGAVDMTRDLILGQAAGLKHQFNSSVLGNSFNFSDGLSPAFARDLKAYEEKASKPVTVPVTATNGIRLQGPDGAPLTRSLPAMNDQGWALKKDAKGNLAYVSPDGKSFTEAK